MIKAWLSCEQNLRRTLSFVLALALVFWTLIVPAASMPPGPAGAAEIADTAAPQFVAGSETLADGITVNDPYSTISGTFSDDVGLDNSTLQLSLGDILDVLIEEIQFEGGTFSYVPTSAFDDGPIQVRVRISDSAGNVSADTTWEFTVSSAPLITSAAAGGGTVVAGYINATNTSLTVSGSVVSEPLGSQIVELYLGGAPFPHPVTMELFSPITTFSIEISGEAFADLIAGQGTKNITAIRTGSDSNVSDESATISIIVDTIAPTAPGDLTDEGAYTIDLTALSASWSASSDEGSGLDHYEMAIGTTAGGGETAAYANIGNVTSYEMTGLALTSGQTYFISVRAVDSAGGVSTSAATDGIVADNVAPSFLSIIASSNNILDTTRARVGDAVSVSFDAINLDGGDPAVTLGGRAMAKDPSSSGDHFLYQRVADGTETEGGDAVLIDATDPAGNTGTATASITLDFTAPVTSDNASADWSNTDVAVTLNIIETAGGPVATRYSTDGSDPTTPYSVPFTLSAEGQYQLKYYSVDAAGNVEPVVTGTLVSIDKTKPASTAAINPLVPDGSNGWHKTATTAALEMTDTIAGTGRILYHYDAEADAEYSGILTLPQGSHTLYYHAIDAAGNTGDESPVEFKVDTAKPTFGAGTIIRVDMTGDGNHDTVTADKQLHMVWDAASDATSGVDHYLMKVRHGTSGSSYAITEFDIGNATEYTLTSEQADLLSEGVYSVGIRAVDAAGNINSTSARYSNGITIDQTGPASTSISIDAGAIYANSTTVTLTLAAADSFVPLEMKLSNSSDLAADGINPDSGGWIAFASSKSWQLFDGDGEKTVYVQFRDGGGNPSSIISDNIILDTVVRVDLLSLVTIASSNAHSSVARVGDTVTVHFEATEAISAPIVTIVGQAALVSGGGTDYDATHTLTGGDTEGPVSFSISGYANAAGEQGKIITAATDASSVLFDKTGPTIGGGSPIGSTGNHRPAILATLTDAGSGINTATIRMRINGVVVPATYAPATGVISYTRAFSLPERSYFVAVDARDLAGNTALRYGFSFTVTP